MASASPAPRTRRRGTAVEAAILDAAWAELTEVGHEQVTMGAVAERAGTAKAVLYRRWSNRGGLIAAAIARRISPLRAERIDTGDLRADLLTLLRSIKHRCDVVAVISDPDGGIAAQIRRTAAMDGFDQMEMILSQARQRGEIDDGLSDDMARLPINVLYSELSLAEAPIADQSVGTIVDDIFLPLVFGVGNATAGRVRARTVAEPAGGRGSGRRGFPSR